MGTEFRFGENEKGLEIMHNHGNVLSASELYDHTWLKRLILRYVHFTTVKKNKIKNKNPHDLFP